MLPRRKRTIDQHTALLVLQSMLLLRTVHKWGRITTLNAPAQHKGTLDQHNNALPCLPVLSTVHARLPVVLRWSLRCAEWILTCRAWRRTWAATRRRCEKCGRCGRWGCVSGVDGCSALRPLAIHEHELPAQWGSSRLLKARALSLCCCRLLLLLINSAIPFMLSMNNTQGGFFLECQ